MMTSKGRMRPSNWHLALLSAILSAHVVVAALPVCAEEARAPSVEALLRRFAELPGLEATFREEKHIALLAAPLVTEGTLHFTPPGRMARHSRTPSPSSVVVSDGMLSFGDGSGDGYDRIDLASSPVVRLFVESFVAILAGDQGTLERMYTMAIAAAPDGQGWRLTLTPRLADMRRVLRQVTVQGRGATIEQMRSVEVSGDETVTTFSDVDTTRRYTDAEVRRIFSVRPPR